MAQEEMPKRRRVWPYGYVAAAALAAIILAILLIASQCGKGLEGLGDAFSGCGYPGAPGCGSPQHNPLGCPERMNTGENVTLRMEGFDEDSYLPPKWTTSSGYGASGTFVSESPPGTAIFHADTRGPVNISAVSQPRAASSPVRIQTCDILILGA